MEPDNEKISGYVEFAPWYRPQMCMGSETKSRVSKRYMVKLIVLFACFFFFLIRHILSLNDGKFYVLFIWDKFRFVLLQFDKIKT